MSNFNLVILTGHVGNVPEVKQTTTGKVMTTLSLATSKGTGENKVTEWHSVKAFDKTAELIQQYVGKGDLITITGRLSYSEYENKDGVKIKRAEVLARELNLFPKTMNPVKEQRPQQYSPAPQRQTNDLSQNDYYRAKNNMPPISSSNEGFGQQQAQPHRATVVDDLKDDVPF